MEIQKLENRKSSFPRTNTAYKPASKRGSDAIDENIDRRRTENKLHKSSPHREDGLEKKCGDPWQDFQRLFKSDLGGRGFVVHTNDNSFSALFVREFKTENKIWLSRLRITCHRNVVSLQKAFHHDGVLFLFYELMDVCLSAVFATPFGQLKPYEVAAFCQEILSGLVYIHETLQLAHGELNSSTVLLSMDGAVKIADIGRCMLKKDVDQRSVQGDVRSLGQMIIECLEPRTFLRKEESLTHTSWDPMLRRFVEQTKMKTAEELLQDDFLKLSPGPNCLKPYIRLARDSMVNHVEIFQ